MPTITDISIFQKCIDLFQRNPLFRAQDLKQALLQQYNCCIDNNRLYSVYNSFRSTFSLTLNPEFVNQFNKLVELCSEIQKVPSSYSMSFEFNQDLILSDPIPNCYNCFVKTQITYYHLLQEYEFFDYHSKMSISLFTQFLFNRGWRSLNCDFNISFVSQHLKKINLKI